MCLFLINLYRFMYATRLRQIVEALGNVNTDVLECAPSISADGRTLLLTRLRRGLGAQPAIYVAQRDEPSQPFGPARRLAALEGFVEATTFSVDERAIYYHRKVDDRFVLFMATKR